MKRSIYLFQTISAVALLSGCMGYKPDGGAPDGIKTVYINPVHNRTDEPALELQVAKALRERIQFDGRVKLVNTPKQADGIINVSLTDYRLSSIAYRKDLKTAPREYRLRISASSTLSRRGTPDKAAESETYGEAVFEFKSDLTTSKRGALPTAAWELAKFITDDLLEQW